jgi:hypothetical protein
MRYRAEVTRRATDLAFSPEIAGECFLRFFELHQTS